MSDVLHQNGMAHETMHVDLPHYFSWFVLHSYVVGYHYQPPAVASS